MQRCRELFAAAMRRVDDLVYDPEGDQLLLRGEEATAESLSSEEDRGESKGDITQVRVQVCPVSVKYQ